jgi:hypothetical protein
MELGLVTLKRIGFFCFPIKHSTHTVISLNRFMGPVDDSVTTDTKSQSHKVTGGVLVRRHFGARAGGSHKAGESLYGMELGSVTLVTLKRICFFCFPIKHSTHTRVGESPNTWKHFGPELTQE